MHIALVAGEESGDILGAALIKALNERRGDLRFSGVGGRRMQAASLLSHADMSRLSVMGLFEVLRHLPDLFALRRDLLRIWQKDKPDLFIGIDAPDFNLPLARILHGRGVKTVHYVSPSVWAWREKRIGQIRDAVDLMLCLFPFETSIYEKNKIAALCVGHPLRDELDRVMSRDEALSSLGLSPKWDYLALMPGSRLAEVQRLLPLFLQAVKSFLYEDAHMQLLLPLAHEGLRGAVEGHVRLFGLVKRTQIVRQKAAAELMPAARAALLASGTVTLEAMLAMLPMAVAYRVHPLTALLARRLLKISHFSLPNLLAGSEVVPELIQENCTVENLRSYVQKLWYEESFSGAQLQAFKAIKQAMPTKGGQRAAEAVLNVL